ncbi:MAG: L-rhamnose mutarotase [Burkholderiaceae bacterium]
MTLPAGESLAFCLRLRPGCEQEYRRRHDAIWPGMAAALSGAGILHFEIFLEPASMLLFAFQVRCADHRVDDLPKQVVWQRWQAHMADLLVQIDGKPERILLEPMFRLGAHADLPPIRSTS